MSSNIMLDCDLQVIWCLKVGVPVVAEVETTGGMEGSSKPETVPPGMGRTSAMSGPLLSDPYSQNDSFLTAARLVRRGWTEEGKNTGWQFSYSDGNQAPKRAEISQKDPRSRRVPVTSGRKTTEDRETRSETQTADGSLSANRQAERQIVLCSQAGIVCVLVTGRRTTCRRPRRFKAPILPVIAEI